MKKYRILVCGEGFQIKGESGKSGFYTTRYVEGQDDKDATQITLDLIKIELSNNIERTSSPKMFVKEIVELESFEDAKVPGSGFSWFPE